MPDVFVSYARSTETRAREVADLLRALGYDVWRDDQLPVHREFSTVIEERLRASKAVLVLWSADAARSRWVCAEADVAHETGVLVQVSIDGVLPPMPFNRIQCADLAGWSGDPDAPGWRKVLASVAELAGAGNATSAPPASPRPTLPAKPSIAVLPFANLSNDPDQDHFVDGMVEEIVGSLSHFKSIFVIAAASSLTFKGKDIGPSDAARRLGVRFVLEGSVRKSAGRVRISVNLIDAADGAQIWSQRWDDTLDDVFALQDKVALCVAGVIEPALQSVDMQRAQARPTVNLSSYDLFLRGTRLFWTFKKEETLQAIDLLDRAVEMVPDFGSALAQGAVCRRQAIDHGWTDEPERYRREGLALAERALMVGASDARVLALVANSLPGLEGKLERAVTLIARAVDLNSGSAFVWLISGVLQLRNGAPDLAAEHLETAMRLDPLSADNGISSMYLAFARFAQTRYDEALILFGTTAFRIPASYAVLAALHGHLGQIDLAREQLAAFRARTANQIEDVAEVWFPRPEHRRLFLDGLARAEAQQ
ncbi:MAG TPA: TIR domain-containing protein [Caulobacteraceae bacterium]|jgi:adenylate cyclase|nr:TIR domain-containing protein [Caulobacteraceae bacterium]